MSASPTRRCCSGSTPTSGSPTSSTRSRRGPTRASARTTIWDKAEFALIESLRRSGCEFEVSPGEGAFYGPKIEYTLKDAIGREWQCGTMQVDFSMAERLGAEYVAETGERRTPVMLHRAIVGSLERFIGILIEQHAGALPAWLAPVQVALLDITDGQADYAGSSRKCFKNKELESQSICGTRRLTIKSASIRCRRFRTSSSSATRKRQTEPLRCVPAAIRISV